MAHGNTGAWGQGYNKTWEEDGVRQCGNRWLRPHLTKYKDATESSVKRVNKDRKRKATEEAKASRGRSKYMRTDDSTQLAELIADMTRVLHLMKFLTMFQKTI